MHLSKSSTVISKNSAAVTVRNAQKTFGNGKPVLNDLNLTVPSGSIYGLLGASGCGKTTLLSCIVGLCHLDRGNVFVYGKPAGIKNNGNVGYMPQEIAIQSIFTIKEILMYYSRIYGMPASQVQGRIEFLIEFLDLPESSQIINTCSGGQQRRISLAVAMLNQPRLLILDEPTVGIDSVVRENIWRHLREIVEKEKITVIISTHYINEAAQSNYVGIMRNGCLLVENSPEYLLKYYGDNSLESVFLKLCHENEQTKCSNAKNQSKLQVAKNTNVTGLRYTSLEEDDQDSDFSFPSINNENSEQSFGHHMWKHFDKISAVVLKNCLTLLRLPWFLLPLILIPPFVVVTYNVILGHNPAHIPFGIVNNDIPYKDDSVAFCNNHVPGCFVNYTSCQLLNSFNNVDIDWISFSTEEKALKGVKNGNILGYITIPENYTLHILQRSLYKKFMNNETVDGTMITGRMDETPVIKSNFVKNKIGNGLLKFAMNLATLCGSEPREVDIPIKFNAVFGSTTDLTILEFMQPGSLLLAIILLPMASALHLILDRKAGTLQRGIVAGLKYIHTIIGFFLTESVLIGIQLGLCYGVLSFFQVKIIGNLALFWSICFLTGIIGLAIGFLFGNICQNEVEAALCVMAFFCPLITTSGITWPMQAMPEWIRIINSLNPLTLPVEALRSIMNKGWGISNPQILTALALQFAWIFIIFGVSGLCKRMNNK